MQNGAFDGVEIHAVHEGYLLDQFAISMFNQRTDGMRYTGKQAMRSREVVERDQVQVRTGFSCGRCVSA